MEEKDDLPTNEPSSLVTAASDLRLFTNPNFVRFSVTLLIGLAVLSLSTLLTQSPTVLSLLGLQ